MRLTEEQAHAVDTFGTGNHLRVIAYAGAGKTSTLVQMAKARQTRGIYIAFNRAIAQEAGAKFPMNVQCRTSHSIAYRTIAAAGYDTEKMTTAISTRVLHAARLAIPLCRDLSAETTKQLLTQTIRNFCQSDLDAPRERHVPKPKKPVDEDAWRDHRAAIARAARELWSQMIDQNSRTPLGHDGYVKLWQLGKPRLPCEVLYIDEAQDLNPVLIDVAQNQDCQLVSVGDSHQQIYAWRGAVDALNQLPGFEVRLTQSFRFGANIANFANGLLEAMGETVPLRGNGRTDDYIDGESSGLASAILCRTNSGVIQNAAMLLDLGVQVWVPGGANEMLSLVEDAERLQGGQGARSADLLGFSTWREVVDHSNTDDGAGFKVFVSLVDKYGCRELRRILGQVLPSQTEGAVAISTGHKSKGLEWSEVELFEDFMIAGRDVSIEERRLFYVAATRAKHGLMVGDDLADAYRK
jgi:superfamily I DNA/RNA helicase